jgi:glyoxylase-like metal-dependent hydrolase (beta-lactamase superfamily II)
VGTVNAYLIYTPPFTLIDPGPDIPQTRRVLNENILNLGLSLDQINRVVITHAHTDHCGLAQWVHELSGAKIYLHPYEWQKVTGNYDFFQERLPFLLEMGIPDDVLLKLVNNKDILPPPYITKDSLVEVIEGEDLFFETGMFKILHFPGHAPGHLCLYDPEEKSLLSGDFLLPHITPNPLLEPDPENKTRRAPSLRQYTVGLTRLEKMNLKKAWPGHGEVIENVPELLRSFQEHHLNRFKTILNLLSPDKKLNIYQICQLLYPGLQGFEIFLGLSEIQAHLDVLVEKKQVIAWLQGTVFFYSRVQKQMAV